VKLTVRCDDFRPLRRNTLCGFASVFLPEIGLRIKDVTIFEKGSKRWAGLPAKPQISKDGTVIRDDAGKQQYVSILEFSSRDISDAFSAAVIRAVLEHSPDAFDGEQGSERSRAAVPASDTPF
jgi:hypothetical protein